MTLTETTTTTMNKMPTTSANALNAKKRQPIGKWSGSDEPQSYYSREDDDGVTLRKDVKWYDVHNHDNNYPEHEECTHVPFMNLTKEERKKKSANFKFGLCCDCDYGLDDKSEFVCQPRRNGSATIYTNTCNACYNYYMNLFEKGVGGEHGGCN